MFLYGPVTFRKFWWKPENRQLAPKSPIFKMTENHHGAQFHVLGKNSNDYKLHIVGKDVLSGLILY